jgi:hypothetical protein
MNEAGIRFFLILASSRREEHSVIALTKVQDVRDEWFRALAADHHVAGFLHCGEERPAIDDVHPFFRPSRLSISDAARQVLPPALTESFAKLGFLPQSPRLRRMKVFVLTDGWDSSDTNLTESVVPVDLATATTTEGLQPRPAQFPSLLAAVDAVLEGRPERHRVALRARLGRDGVRVTLAEAGDKVGLTRERVRQVEERLHAEIVVQPWATFTVELLCQLRGDGRPLSVSRLADADPWFSGLPNLPEFLRTIVPVISDDQLQVMDAGGELVICPASVPEWTVVTRRCIDAAERLVGTAATWADVTSAFAGVLAAAGAPELTSAAYASCSDALHYAGDGRLIAVGTSHPDIVEGILRESDTPLHYAEIAQRWADRVGEPVHPLRASRALSRSHEVLLLGRGTYGLEKHLPLPADVADDVIADCEYIVLNSKRERQWHASELLEVLRDLRPDLPDVVDKYVLSAYLARSATFRSVGRLVWCRTDESSGETQRIDLRDAAVDALTRAGCPLGESVLRAQIRQSRGLNRGVFCLQSTDRLVKVAPGTWGLFPRDFFLTEEESTRLAESTFTVLRTRGKGLHSSEMRDALAETGPLDAGITGYMLQQIAARDERMKLFYGELIGLSDWNEPRRLNLSRAADLIAREAVNGLTLDEFHELLEKAIERPIARPTVCSLLSASDLIFDPTDRVWKRGTELDNAE